jgi:hypothetical protein
LYHCCLVSLGHVQTLEYLLDAVGLKVLLVVEPHIWLRGVVIHWDLDAANLRFGVLVI